MYVCVFKFLFQNGHANVDKTLLFVYFFKSLDISQFYHLTM